MKSCLCRILPGLLCYLSLLFPGLWGRTTSCLTSGARLYSQKLANIHFWCHLIGDIGMGAFMGMA